MDFELDFINIIKKDLFDMGIKYNEAGKKILYLYVDRINRFIDSDISYTIEYSDEFTRTLDSLTKKQRSGIGEIERRLKNKETIRGFLSNTLFAPLHKDIDTLLKNWNIQHIHLSKNRSSSLLFFIKQSDKIYFINVFEHPKGDGWFKKDFLEIIDANWPWLLTGISGATEVINSLNEGDVHKKSSKQFTLVALKNRVVISTNLGVTSSGISQYALRKIDSILEMLNTYQKHFQDNMEELREEIREHLSIELDQPLQLELILEGEQFIAYDEHYQVKIPMFSETISNENAHKFLFPSNKL